MWSECRRQAAAFFSELAPSVTAEGARACAALAVRFADIAAQIAAVREPQIAAQQRIRQLRHARESEQQSLPDLECLVNAL